MNIDWDAKNYEVGNLLQHTVSRLFLDRIKIKENSSILDIGTGDGSFSLEIAKQAPLGRYLAIDRSEAMLALCNQKCQHLAHVNTMKLEVDAMKFENEFDIVCSFWCLHWLTDFKRAFNNIYHALRPKGQALLILTAGEDPHAWTYLALKNQKRFKSLENFISPIDYEKLLTLEQSIANLPFSDLSVSRPPVSIPLPNLTLLRQFFEGISFFYRGQLNDSEIHEVIEAQLEIFDTHCKEKFDGRYLFELKPYVITLTK